MAPPPLELISEFCRSIPDLLGFPTHCSVQFIKVQYSPVQSSTVHCTSTLYKYSTSTLYKYVQLYVLVPTVPVPVPVQVQLLPYGCTRDPERWIVQIAHRNSFLWYI